jgi:alpha-D-xyloside xylohydrolase
VFRHDGSVDYYVPEGKWTSLLDGNVIEGPRWVRETHDFLSLPSLVRPNSVIPVGNRTDKPDYDYSDGVTLQVYQLEDGKQVRVEIPAVDGKIATRFDIKREGNMIHMQRQGLSTSWNVLLIGVKSVENATSINGSAFIEAGAQLNELNIQLG